MHDIPDTKTPPRTHLRFGSPIAHSSRHLELTNHDIDALNPIPARDIDSALLNVVRLQLLTADIPPQVQTAADLVRSMRNEDRY